MRSIGTNDGEKLFFAEHPGAAENSVVAGGDQFGHAPNVIVMPVGRNDKADITGRGDAEAIQIL